MPGVPPNALGKLKGMLKGMLKGGNKKRQDQSNQQPAKPAAPAAPQTQQTAATATNAPPDTGKTLPPTNPSVTGGTVTPQSAVPAGLAAAAAGGAGAPAASDVNLVGVPAPTDKTLKEPEDEDKPQVSPTDPVSGSGEDSGKSEPVSAITQDEKSLPPPRTDGAEDEVKAVEPEAPAPASTSQPVQHTTAIAQQLDPAVTNTADENTKPNGIAPTGAEVPKSAVASAASPDTSTTQPATAISDEKMPVMAEPPQVKPVNTAPGMSATSGPLEDFPEGGVEQK